MKNICIVIFIFCWSLTANGTSLKSNQVSAFYSIRSVLEIYKTKYGNSLPSNWQDFIDSGILSGEVLDSSRRFLDIENRYVFVDLKPMQFGNRLERVLIMARQAGGEGDDIDSEDPANRPGRLLIVEASDGSIQTRKYSEVMLRMWFEKAGLSLADFTSAAPPAPKFNPPRKEPNSEGVALGGPVNPSDDSNGQSRISPKREKKPMMPAPKINTESQSYRLRAVWFTLGILAVVLFGWLVCKRFITGKTN